MVEQVAGRRAGGRPSNRGEKINMEVEGMKITAAHRHAILTFDRFPLDAEEIEVIGKFGETPNDLSAL
jgi:hypothetical protein